ncbi:polysaccharide deacetylase family protein [Flavobacterium sp. LB2R40]|uniref:polysaccharide deacetylase family protein n=1 Tax=unclassified Flavobacterium TaxID=196869 RepID=UPI003AAD2393
MKFYWIKTHWIIKKIFSNYTWDVSKGQNTVYLTFDDGPIPEVTTWVLDELKKYDLKATFFCIGENIKKNPDLFKKIICEGHAIGNHTFNHLNGWKTPTGAYIENTQLCKEVIEQTVNSNLKTKIFRPPYGKLKTAQSIALRKLGYQIIMWDVLSADFDTTIPKEQCLQNVITNVKPGSIIVFHDSLKAFKNLEYVLPKTLEFLKEKNYTCAVL